MALCERSPLHHSPCKLRRRQLEAAAFEIRLGKDSAKNILADGIGRTTATASLSLRAALPVAGGFRKGHSKERTRRWHCASEAYCVTVFAQAAQQAAGGNGLEIRLGKGTAKNIPVD